MNKVNIDDLIMGLREITDNDFTCEKIGCFLIENSVETASLEKYLFWSEKFYTRNLIYKDHRFEALALCWGKGQFSPIHNHSEQKCWMTVPVGTLHGQNFKVVEFDVGENYCKLERTTLFDLSNSLVSTVDLNEPVHQILNLPEYNAQAVSIHIYSRPFEKCLTYCLENHTFKEVNLRYTSIDGQLCPDIAL